MCRFYPSSKAEARKGPGNPPDPFPYVFGDADLAPGRRRGPSMSRARVRTRPPHVDAGEQEQPHHVDEVPVPGRRLEAEMQLRRERAAHGPDQAHREKDGADDDVEPVETGRHEEGR